MAYWAAIGAIGAGIASAWGNADQARVNRSFQADESQRNREYTSYMSGTAHQREVADLQAAGLNPILSGTGGMGAVTPAGNQPSGAQGSFDGITQGVNSAIAAKRLDVETSLIHQQAENQSSQASATAAGIRGILENNRRLTAEADMAESMAKGAKIEGDIDTTAYGKWMRYIQRGTEGLSPWKPRGSFSTGK